MPRITKIYTRTGDDGTTALGSKQRVQKSHLRIEAYGTIDELNSMIGLAVTKPMLSSSVKQLTGIQNSLFHLGSELAFPPDETKEYEIPVIEQRHIDQLEEWIDELTKQLGPLENFVLPGGCEEAAMIHVCRAVCRRAERRIGALAETETVRPEALQYINRLSDFLFMLARDENKAKQVTETLWDSHA